MSKLTTLTKNRDRLFYDKFEHCVSWQQPQVRHVRSLDAASVQKQIQRSQELYQRFGVRVGFKYTPKHFEFNQDVLAELELTRDFLARQREAGTEFKMVFFWDYISVYHNNPDILGIMTVLDPKHAGRYRFTLSRAVVNKVRDTVTLPNPRYQYRTYLRSKEFSQQQYQTLAQWLDKLDPQDVQISGSLARWLDIKNQADVAVWTPVGVRKKLYCAAHYFLDYNDPAIITMLSLMHPGLVRKTCAIVKKQ